jgi:hypothetical protein
MEYLLPGREGSPGGTGAELDRTIRGHSEQPQRDCNRVVDQSLETSKSQDFCGGGSISNAVLDGAIGAHIAETPVVVSEVLPPPLPVENSGEPVEDDTLKVGGPLWVYLDRIAQYDGSIRDLYELCGPHK